MKVRLILLFPYFVIVDVVPELPPRVAPRGLTSPTAGAAAAAAVAIDNIDGTVATAPPPPPPTRPGGVT